ncbi:hypermethylated in cancer 2 protein [Osmerus mordax]|uniref:hypermethylated in cancer 2 protein n=1 Tax=Osmerus mordax TaxID=8014 RepID=UPI00350F640C
MEHPNYAKQLLLQMNQQRSKGYLCDVIIVVENALFRAHKNVLAASSSYFKSLVLHDNLINLDTEMVNPAVFRQVLDFIYTGNLANSDPVSDHSMSALLTAASYLQLTDLAAMCRRRLKRNGRTSSSKIPTSTTSPISNGRFSHPQRLSSTPLRVTHNNHYQHSGSREVEKSHNQKQDGRLKEDLSEEEVFISGSRCMSLSPSAGDGVNNGVDMGLGLGLDLSKKSPSGSTATEEVSPSSLAQGSPPSGSPSTTNSASFEYTPTNPTTASVKPGQEAGEDKRLPQKTTTDLLQRAAHKRPRPRSLGSKVGELKTPLPNGLGKSRGIDGAELSHRGDSLSPELGEGDGEENGLEQSEESGQSESEGGRRNQKRNANYIYRQPQQGFEPPLGDNLYVCIPCGKGFPSSEQLNAHVDTHTEDELYIKKEEDEDEEEDGVSPKEEDQDDPEDLRSQIMETEPDMDGSPPCYNCTICSKSYKDPASLRQHEKSHWLSRPFPCNICGKLFTQRGTMTRHMRSHLGLKPFACEECGMRFTRQYRLTEHMRVHSGEKPYECKLCGGKFTQQRNLLSHLKMHSSPS